MYKKESQDIDNENKKSEQPLLEVKNLKTYFKTESGTVKAVDDISFSVKKGQTIGIVGESGSGKSVTSLSLMGLVPSPPGKIVDGEIIFDSREFGKIDLAKLPESYKRKIRGNEISMIFQEPMTSLNPVITCGEQVMESILLHQDNLSNRPWYLRTLEKIIKYPINYAILPVISIFTSSKYSIMNFFKKLTKKETDKEATIERSRKLKKYLTKEERVAKEKVIELFNKVQLPYPERIFYSYPHEISGGQKQRVMIAMAMSCNPSVLIADEPTTALDVTVQAKTLDLMRQLRDENNMSIIFITHDLGVIAEIADYVLVMYHGKVVEQGPVYEIFSDPSHPYTKGLLACRPRLDFKLKVLPTVDDFMSVNKDGEMEEKANNAFMSVGQALLFNFTSDEEMMERHQQIEKAQPILKVKNLKTYYSVNKNSSTGRHKLVTKAVDDVSFEVYPGETVGLVGESGCGKSTLGKSIMRLVDVTSGEIEFNLHADDPKNILTYNARELRKMRKDVQIIFQDPYSSLNPKHTIGETLLEAMRVNNMYVSDFERKKKAIELLEKVNLKSSHFSRYPHEFSGGQRQRICIARAIAVKPKFIICDESVSALDVSVQAQVLNLLNDLKEDFGFTYIFISHDLSVVKFMSDRILVMKNGKILESGYAEEIYENPKSQYTKKLIDAIPTGDPERIMGIQAERSKKF